MNRREFLKNTLMTSLGGMQLASARNDVTPLIKRLPNFLLIVTDDQGWGDLGCYGHPVLKTPSLDMLAAEGCKFTSFYTASPVCAPSRAGILTGRDPNRYGMKFLCHNGQYDAPIYHHVPLNEPMLARELKKAGYRTCHIGKWHLSLIGQPMEPTPHDYGFDHYLVRPPKGQGIYHKPTDWNRNGEIVEGVLSEWTAELYVDEAIDFIRADMDAPFFVNLCSFTPHEDIVSPPQFCNLYSDRTEQEQVYYGALTHQDEALGRLFDFLKSSGLWDNTVILFTSDNGPEPPLLPWVKNSAGSTGPFRGSKHILYEGGIRVPALLRWPGLTTQGSQVDEPVSALDIFPTFCEAAGISRERTLSLDGVDIRPVLEKNPVNRPHALFWQYDRAPKEHAHRGSMFTSPPLALRKGCWKILCDETFEHKELYNLDFDMGEKWDLSQKHPDIVARMTKELAEIFEDVRQSEKASTGYLNPAMPEPSKSPLVLG